MPNGKIIKGIGGFYFVSALDGVYECSARGIFRKDSKIPLPGDNIIFTVLDENKKIGSIEEITERKNELVRPAVANIDQVAVVIATKSPNPDYILLDKLLITAHVKNIEIIIIINKCDLDTVNESEFIKKIYSNSSYKTMVISSKDGIGLDDVKAFLFDKTTVLAGQSGVGKSTVLNKIFSAKMMETGAISKKIARGKHTTRHAELLQLESGGFVVDTPGFSSFELEDVKHDELDLFYPEFFELRKNCKFKTCSHINEPNCAIKDQIDKGTIDIGRYNRYKELYGLLKEVNDNIYKNKKNNKKTKAGLT